MKYSAKGGAEVIDSWAEAAREGGCEPQNPAPGQNRHWLVDAYVSVGDSDVRVSDVWASELSAEARKALLRDLGLPIKKQIMHGEVSAPGREKVSDFMIDQVWDGWCSLLIKREDGSLFDLPIHSDYLGQMNKSAGYVVFDLETTGTDPNTCEIAEIAAIRVIGGEVAHEFSTFVHIDGEMPDNARSVNHIADEYLTDAPHMRAALEPFIEFIGDDSVLVGHNINVFDIPVLTRVAANCGLEFKYSKAEDTLALSKMAWPDLGRYNMDNLRKRLGLSGDGAHRALKDCMDEMRVYELAKKELADHPERTKRGPKAASRKSTSRPGASYSGKWARKKAKEFTTDVVSFDTLHPAFGRFFVLSGEVPGHDYDECLQRVKDLGGEPQDNVTKKTNYLIVGDGAGAGKTKKALANQEAGQDIKIIGPDEFLRIVGWEG